MRSVISLIVFLYAISVVYPFSYIPDALADQITSLPGAEDLAVSFQQFSGYLDIPGHDGNSKHMHYWLVESMHDPATDPLAFWTNGVSHTT
jgi:hypothetical protein